MLLKASFAELNSGRKLMKIL